MNCNEHVSTGPAFLCHAHGAPRARYQRSPRKLFGLNTCNVKRHKRTHVCIHTWAEIRRWQCLRAYDRLTQCIAAGWMNCNEHARAAAMPDTAGAPQQPAPRYQCASCSRSGISHLVRRPATPTMPCSAACCIAASWPIIHMGTGKWLGCTFASALASSPVHDCEACMARGGEGG